jgi:hypothetical protein
MGSFGGQVKNEVKGKGTKAVSAKPQITQRGDKQKQGVVGKDGDAAPGQRSNRIAKKNLGKEPAHLVAKRALSLEDGENMAASGSRVITTTNQAAKSKQ